MLTRDYLTDTRTMRAVWTLSAADPGTADAPVEAGAWRDKSVQVEGDLGTATVVVEGSNSGLTWSPLVILRYPDLAAATPNAALWRARVLTPDDQTAVTVTLIGVRA